MPLAYQPGHHDQQSTHSNGYWIAYRAIDNLLRFARAGGGVRADLYVEFENLNVPIHV